MTREDVVAAAVAKGLIRPKVLAYKLRDGPVLFKLRHGPDSDRRSSAPATLDDLFTSLGLEAPSPH